MSAPESADSYISSAVANDAVDIIELARDSGRVYIGIGSLNDEGGGKEVVDVTELNLAEGFGVSAEGEKSVSTAVAEDDGSSLWWTGCGATSVGSTILLVSSTSSGGASSRL